jgi:hypothetical protein
MIFGAGCGPVIMMCAFGLDETYPTIQKFGRKNKNSKFTYNQK